MKKFLTLALLATSVSGYAADNREIQDIMYLPNAGTTYGFTTGVFADRTIEGTVDTDVTGYRLNQTIGHTFTDRLSVEGTINYTDLEAEVKDDVIESQKGISDPSVTARFRTMDESFRWDVIGGATISLGDRELDDTEFNNYQGGSSLFAGTQFGGKSESFQWALTGRLTHFMESTTDVDGVGKFDSDSINALLVQADILNPLSEKWFLRSNVSANFLEDRAADDANQDEAASSVYGIGTEIQHKVATDLLLRAGVTYNSINQDTSNNDDDTSWNYLLGANYQF